MEQIRVAIKELPQLLDAKLNLKNWLTQSAKD
jgi:hypothetical protein